MLMVPDWILKGLGQVKHKDYGGRCLGDYPESLIKIGYDSVDEA